MGPRLGTIHLDRDDERDYNQIHLVYQDFKRLLSNNDNLKQKLIYCRTLEPAFILQEFDQNSTRIFDEKISHTRAL
jgi:hypothetical protein